MPHYKDLTEYEETCSDRSQRGWKTTLTQALRGEKIHYHKTQYVNNFDVIVDTPGEYAQTKGLGHAWRCIHMNQMW